jgi:cellulose 1,4-beta-cellobiosidase
VLDMAGGPDRIRGFATNTSNYNALDGEWGKALEPTTPTPSEYQYVQKLAETMAETGIKDKGYIIDTSRNGVQESRTVWGHWCNIAKAGIGERPKVSPRPLLDAFYWIKPPGESDGVADKSAARFDENCASSDARADAPEAGHWFAEHLIEMMKAANPPL